MKGSMRAIHNHYCALVYQALFWHQKHSPKPDRKNSYPYIAYIIGNRTDVNGWGYSSVEEWLLNMYKAMGYIPSTRENKEKPTDKNNRL